jgi:hypothetical protein
MKLCKDCHFICKPAGSMYEPHPESICLSPKAMRTNFVTGAFYQAKCKDINLTGECSLFQPNEDKIMAIKKAFEKHYTGLGSAEQVKILSTGKKPWFNRLLEKIGGK